MVNFAELKKNAKANMGSTNAPAKEKFTPKAKSSKGMRPTKSLAVREAGEDQEMNFITGLFEKSTKKGDKYYSAFDKDTAIGYSLFLNKDGSFALKVSQEKESVLLATLKVTKKGHLYGLGQDGRHYMVFDVKEKAE